MGGGAPKSCDILIYRIQMYYQKKNNRGDYEGPPPQNHSLTLPTNIVELMMMDKDIVPSSNRCHHWQTNLDPSRRQCIWLSDREERRKNVHRHLNG